MSEPDLAQLIRLIKQHTEVLGLAETKTKKVIVDAVSVVNRGNEIILPDGMDHDRAINALIRDRDYKNTEVGIHAPIDGFPYAVAYAFQQALVEKHGWVNGVPTPGFFGDTPPQMLTIPGTDVQVPWGRMVMPGIDGWIGTGMDEDDKGRPRFTVTGVVKRKDETKVNDIVQRTREILNEKNIYKGRAFSIKFIDDLSMEYIPMPEPKFLSLNPDLRSRLVFTDEVQDAIDINIFTMVEHRDKVRKLGVPSKWGVLLSGPFGTGKSMVSAVTAQLAVDNGWTFILVEKADELAEALRLARMYQPAVVFVEDIDRVTSGNRSTSIDQLLNTLDGVDSKNVEIMTIMTTNNVNEINQAMLRPGRLDAVINVTPPDVKAAERMLRQYSNNLIGTDEDITPAAELLDGQSPAVIQAVVEKSKAAAVRRHPDLDPDTFGPGTITSDDLVRAARAMRNQIDLLAERIPDTRSVQEKAAGVIADAIATSAVNSGFLAAVASPVIGLDHEPSLSNQPKPKAQ